MSDLKYEDYKEVIEKLANFILKGWLDGELDTSWVLINEHLYTVSDVNYSEDEEAAIVSWSEELIREGVQKARKAIFG